MHIIGHMPLPCRASFAEQQPILCRSHSSRL